MLILKFFFHLFIEADVEAALAWLEKTFGFERRG
jgi:hypothetical protein